MTSTIAGSRYASALVDVVLAPNSRLQAEEAIAQLKMFEGWLAESHDLRGVLLTPAVASSKKRSLISNLAAKAGFAPMIRNFLCVIVDHKRIGQLAEMRQAFEKIIDEKMGFVRVDVTSAAPLGPAESDRMRQSLAELTGKQIRLHASVDPQLLGGAVARIGSTVYDGSVLGQLESMRRRLMDAS